MVKVFCSLESFGIFLKPLASWQLFRIPPGDLANRNIDGADILGKGMQFLWLALAESKAFAERVRVAEDYLLPFAINALARTSIMKSAQHLLHHKGAISIDELANHTALSVRQYERRFADEMGLSPKLFARITRFQMGDTSRNGILCTLTTAADRWGVQALASNLPQSRLRGKNSGSKRT